MTASGEDMELSPELRRLIDETRARIRECFKPRVVVKAALRSSLTGDTK